ncbi:LysR family transcriptional regulator [Achromobacter xylosoxidans]|uniref:LysR family transcriptional regulator n=1 Tax=Alcaligenes xylosoxydans xylosoxydans TaxID=85698 RepID=UPI001F1357BB|nr:LysR family transcriptional regulator [Achromobacter xylosoxidans]
MNTFTSAATLFNRLVAHTRLRHLQVVVQVADLGSVQHAAMQIGISQSAATKHIADVERVLGMPLFERHARGMRPTFICRDLLPLLRHVMGSVGGCAEAAAAAAAGIDGIVRIGAITAAITGVLNGVLPAFIAEQPQVRVELIEDAPLVLLGRYADGEMDMLLARKPALLPADSRYVSLLEDSCIVAARPGHPLARSRRVQAGQLLDFPWVTPPVDSQTYKAFEALFEACGRLPTQQPLSTRSLAAAVHYLQGSDGVIMGPLSFLRGGIEAGSLVRLNCALRVNLPAIGLVHRVEPRNRSVAALLSHLSSSLDAGA